MKAIRLATIIVPALLPPSYSATARAQARTEGVEACSVAYARGQEERLAGRLYNARGAFQQCSSNVCSPELVHDCSHWLQEVEADLPTVRVSVHDEHGATIARVNVTIDGQALSQGSLSAPIVLEAGPHDLRFEAPGYEPMQVEKALRPSDREVSVDVTLRPPAPPPLEKPARPAIPVASWVLAGVGTVAVGTAIYFGVKAKGEYRRLQEECAPACSPASTQTMKDHALMSDIALGGALLSFAAAGVVYLLDGPPSATASAKAPAFSFNAAVSPRGGGVRAQLAF